MRKLIIGLPAYNEEKNISKLIYKINKLKSIYEDLIILIVNDGSTDNTLRIVKDYSKLYSHIKYLDHIENRGLPKTLMTIFKYALNNLNKDDILIILDADNTHNPKIIPDMVNKLTNENLDIVIASRFIKGGKEIGLSTLRKFCSRGASLFSRIAFNIENVTDYSCGYRAYRVGYLKKLYEHYNEELITSEGFECMMEVLVKANKIGVKIGEYPLVLEYNLKEGNSKMKVLKTIMGYFKVKLDLYRLSTVKEEDYE